VAALAVAEIELETGPRSLLGSPGLRTFGNLCHRAFLMLVLRGYAWVLLERGSNADSREILSLTSTGKAADKLRKIKAARAAKS
jgi:hypothetical protein